MVFESPSRRTRATDTLEAKEEARQHVAGKVLVAVAAHASLACSFSAGGQLLMSRLLPANIFSLFFKRGFF